MKNAVNGVAICGCCWGLRVLEIFEKCVEIDKAAGTISYGDGRDNPLIDKVLDQPCADGAVRVELVDLGYCLGVFISITSFCIYLQLRTNGWSCVFSGKTQ